MTPRIETAIDGHLGVIRLNRPEAINALDREMIDGVSAALQSWRNDDAVRAVLFEAEGARGFCSGGDVRLTRTLMLEGRRDEAEAFFAAEYAMNGLISTYDKPVIALTHGIVMGGGIGIAGHAGFRFAAIGCRYAMPEGAIGYFPDIGVNWLLARAPIHRALLFIMLGSPVGTADALALGLADCAVAPEAMPQLRADLVAAASGTEIESGIVRLMQNYSVNAGEESFCALADRIAPVFDLPRADDIVERIATLAQSDPDLAPIAATLRTRCPTSLAIALETHRAARSAASIADVLAADVRLSGWVAAQPDFAEGVRAVLIDKTGAARWSPDHVDAARLDVIKGLISGADPAP